MANDDSETKAISGSLRNDSDGPTVEGLVARINALWWADGLRIGGHRGGVTQMLRNSRYIDYHLYAEKVGANELGTVCLPPL